MPFKTAQQNAKPKPFQSFYLEQPCQANLSILSLHVYLAKLSYFTKTSTTKTPFLGGPKNQKTRSETTHLTSFYGTWLDLELEVSRQEITRRFREGHRLGPHKAAKASVPGTKLPGKEGPGRGWEMVGRISIIFIELKWIRCLKV